MGKRLGHTNTGFKIALFSYESIARVFDSMMNVAGTEKTQAVPIRDWHRSERVPPFFHDTAIGAELRRKESNAKFAKRSHWALQKPVNVCSNSCVTGMTSVAVEAIGQVPHFETAIASFTLGHFQQYLSLGNGIIEGG